MKIKSLYWGTVNDLLRESLELCMSSEVFSGFRLVGGTALSLQIGHRISVDIDLFSDQEYGSIDFEAIDTFLRSNYSIVNASSNLLPGFGRSYFLGNNKDSMIKLDVYYTDAFIQPEEVFDKLRLASIEEIIAMKVDVIQRGGRKKDFWDLHALLGDYSIERMMRLHESRYSYTHDRELIIKNFVSFDSADHDFDPICRFGKVWELIKSDFFEEIEKIS